jgi:FkbM family methyltransferase
MDNSHIRNFLRNLFFSTGYVVTTRKNWLYTLEREEHILTEVEENLLSATSSVLHIGAHIGQEAEKYARLGLEVLWIEGNPKIFEKLLVNITKYENQSARCALLGNINIESIDFHVANNDGLSSSLFELGVNSGFNSLSMIHDLKVPMSRLDSILDTSQISKFKHWVIDVQGAELLVLQGAGDLLNSVFSLCIEVSTRKVYEGGATWAEIYSFLMSRNFTPLWHPRPDSHMNIIFVRTLMKSD